jgi:hypothetical protein
MIKSLSLVLSILSAVTSAFAQIETQTVLYHGYNKIKLTEDSGQALTEFIKQLKQLDIVSISVKSYTDKAGTSQYNNQLSKQRNLYVLHELQTQLPTEIKYGSGYFGEDSLLTLNDQEQEKNRRTIVTVIYLNKPEATVTQVTKLIPYTEDVQEQRFHIDLDDTVTVTAKEGTFIKFASGTFKNKRSELAKGKATLLIKEYYKPSDILLAGMHTVSDGGLLQTGGMFKLLVVQNQDTMLTETQKPVLVRMPDKNNLSGTMNVFVTDHSDTALWNDTRKSFSWIMGSWDWPTNYSKLQDFFVDNELRFERFAVGRKIYREYYLSNSISLFGGKGGFISFDKPLTKYVKYLITKKDSATLSVNFYQKFKRRGYRKFGMRTFDTTFLVKYSSSFYETTLSGINYINCDRFLNNKQVTDFYVRTPEFDGAQVLVYFKNLNAFMPAGYTKERYKVERVPTEENVYLIAVGKKGGDFYYGKKDFTISKIATVDVAMQKVSYDEMKKMFTALGYQN